MRMHKREFYHIFLYIFGGLLPFLYTGEAKAQTITEDDRAKMVREAGALVKQYFTDLNLLTTGEENLRKYRDEDIDGAIKNYFYSPTAYIYNDLAPLQEREADSLRIREYLEKAYSWYPKGVKFDCSFNTRNPCPQTETRDDSRFFVVKVVVNKTLQGMYKSNISYVNTDSLDVFVQFVLKQDRPNLILDNARIFRIAKHKNAECPIRELLEEDKKPFLLPDDNEEREWLRQRAVLFVKDYAVTLNIIGNPLFSDRYETTDYFESENTTVFNDIVPILRIGTYKASEYLANIENWYQSGVTFKYKNVRAITVLPDFDHVSVEVQADRFMKSYGVGDDYKHRQRLSFTVRFPVVTSTQAGDEKKVVGLERITPRISAVTAVPPRVNPRLYWVLGLQAYSSNYFGDIAPSSRIFSTDLRRTNPALGLYLQRKLSNHWGVRFNFLAVTLSADDFGSNDINNQDDLYRFIRNLHFRNRVREFSASMVYEFYGSKGKFYARRRFTPYVAFGLGIFRNKPEARSPISTIDVSRRWEDLRALGTEGQGREGYRKKYATWQPVLPLSIGVRYKVNRRIDFCFEIGGRLTVTDFIDDVSGNYPNYADFNNDSKAIQMSNRTLEPFSAFTQKSRAEGLAAFAQRGGQAISYRGTDGRLYETINGYGRAGEKRGTSSNNDYYAFAGFQINYLLNVGDVPGTQKSGKGRFNIKFD
jgi:hypothetical protein